MGKPLGRPPLCTMQLSFVVEAINKLGFIMTCYTARDMPSSNHIRCPAIRDTYCSAFAGDATSGYICFFIILMHHHFDLQASGQSDCMDGLMIESEHRTHRLIPPLKSTRVLQLQTADFLCIGLLAFMCFLSCSCHGLGSRFRRMTVPFLCEPDPELIGCTGILRLCMWTLLISHCVRIKLCTCC